MVFTALDKLIDYGIEKELIAKEDRIFVMNRFLEILELNSYTQNYSSTEMCLEEVLTIILDDAVERGIIEDSIVYRDLLDTKLMGAMTPFPREVQSKFNTLYKNSPENATDWFYKFSCDTDYIRRYRTEKDVKWKTKTKYGELDITINLAKPEKDPKAIAAAKNQKTSGYPSCLLCKENEGFSGHLTWPARQNHRILPLTIGNKAWHFQYSPYVYYNEHCILFSAEHVPMKIEKATFSKMLDFLEAFPHYFVGSNADLPIVGGSILSHDHFQGGRYTFAMEKAETLAKFAINSHPDVCIETINWPMSVLRLTSENRENLVELSDEILSAWRTYTDEEAFIFAETNGEPHNTITPIGRRVGKAFQLDLVLRNNITTEEHPLGVYHPHAHLHHIKKENIGLIEVMGLAVLPSRLKEEIEILQATILQNEDIRTNEKIEKHADWVDIILQKYTDINSDNIDSILKEEIGLVFEKVLECAGVFKMNEHYFEKFILSLGVKQVN